LLVEDRPEVLVVFEKTLRAAGYLVSSATTGDAGFQRYKEEGPFDLVVTDIVMPGELQGPTMAQQIRKLDPKAKLIFLSGYAREATVHGNGLRPEDVRLMKPVSRASLLEAVEKSLRL
jgi:CheY-like chemotaxis protein